MSAWNVPRGGPIAVGQPVEFAGDPVPFPDTIDEAGWYLLMAVRAADQAIVPALGGNAAGRSYELDRKLLPVVDLQLAGDRELLASERLVRALAAIGASGWEAEIVPHLTPVPVSGHRWYWLRASGFTGPVVDTVMTGPDPQPGLDPITAPARIPLHPLTFDASRWTGQDVAWTPWFGVVTADWRSLVVPGALVAALVARVPDLACGVVPVTMRGATHPRVAEPGQILVDEGAPPQPLAGNELVAAIAASAERHELGEPAGEDELGRLSQQATFALDADYLSLLRRWNGLRLVVRPKSPEQCALTIWSVEERQNAAGSLATWGDYRDLGWFVIGEGPEGGVAWALDSDNVVHGLGREGLVYGPDQPFSVWLGDQLRDAEYLFDQVPGRSAAALWLWEGRS